LSPLVADLGGGYCDAAFHVRNAAVLSDGASDASGRDTLPLNDNRMPRKSSSIAPGLRNVTSCFTLQVMLIPNSDNELLKDRGFLVAVAVAALGVVCLVGLVWNHG
jgi:hypothetical protein